MTKMVLNRGFTLIELLVVIAIIGVLSSVVLASLNSARNKGADAAVKSALASARTQAELFYDANGNSYDKATAATDVCNSSGLVNNVKGVYSQVLSAAQAVSITSVTVDSTVVQTTSMAVCNSGASTWAAQVPLKGGGYWCVDYTGRAAGVATALGAGIQVCPTS